MSQAIIYMDGKPVTIHKGNLSVMLPDLDKNVRVALDTETCGLYVDGDWHSQPAKCQPPARVSAVSLAWIVDGTECHDVTCNRKPQHLHSLAMPFDQGRVSGKPGLWCQQSETFKQLKPLCIAPVKPTKTKPDGVCNQAHDARCHTTNKTIHEYQPGPEPEYNLEPYDFQQLLRWLIDRPLVEHHSKFDSHMMRVGLRYELCCTTPDHSSEDGLHFGQGVDLMNQVVWDTQTVNCIIEPLHQSGLKPTAKRLWGEQEGDEQQAIAEALKKNGTGLTKRYDLVDWSIMGPYAAKDAELTIKLAHRQWKMWDEGAIEQTDKQIIEDEFRLTALLYRMEIKGIPFNADEMRAEALKMHQMIFALEDELPFSPANITEAKKWFFDTLNIPPIKLTGENDPSLDQEVVARLVADEVQGAVTWQRIADLKSALGKWYDRWPYLIGSDGRLRTNFRQGKTESDRSDQKSGGAISGRLSAERVQTQGVPKEMSLPKNIKGVKEFVKDDIDTTEGWELDLSNAEIRVTAWLTRCKALADRINSGANIHDENTKAIFLIDESHSDWERYRATAKIGVFQDLYGGGEQALQIQIQRALKVRHFPIEHIREFKRNLNRAYPEIKQTATLCQRKADKGQGGCGYVRLVNGRKRWFGWGERLHKAMNACIQGGVAEVMKQWMLAIDEEYPSVLINQVHDSVWLELPAIVRTAGNGIAERELVVKDIIQMGERIFEGYFSLPTNPIKFKVDAKRIW